MWPLCRRYVRVSLGLRYTWPLCRYVRVCVCTAETAMDRVLYTGCVLLLVATLFTIPVRTDTEDGGVNDPRLVHCVIVIKVPPYAMTRVHCQHAIGRNLVYKTITL